MRLTRIGVVCAILLAVASGWPAAFDAAEPDFGIRFGIVQSVGPHQFKLTQETTRLPRLTRAQGLMYGVEIRPREGTDYEVFFIARLPAAPKKLSGFPDGTKPAAVVSGIKTPPRRVRGPAILPFWFDAGDPLGPYSLEVFVNGQSRGVIKYDVVAPPGS